MRIDLKGKTTLEKMKLLTGEPVEKIRVFFENLTILSIFDFLDNKETPIPFMGDINISRGEKDGPISFTITMNPNQMLAKNINQILLGQESDVEKVLKKKIRSSLEEIIKT